MKANRPTLSHAAGISPATGACMAALLLLCSCVGPVQTPVAVAPPARMPPPPPQQLPPPTDWHDMPATAGVWRWSREGRSSVARFGLQQVTLLSMTCNPQAGTISVSREDQASTASTMTIHTTSLSRMLPVHPAADGIATITLPARDSLLDAMAFSRGRFEVEVPGLAALYLPSWPEVGRVIEDCR